MVIVTGERRAFLLNCFLDSGDPRWDALRRVEELPTSRHEAPTIEQAMALWRSGVHRRSVFTPIVYLGEIEAAIEILDDETSQPAG